MERAASRRWQAARRPGLRSPRAAGALTWHLPLMVSHPVERVHR